MWRLCFRTPDGQVERMSEQVISALARGVVLQKDEIRKWFERPEVRADYEKWLAERNRRKAEEVYPCLRRF